VLIVYCGHNEFDSVIPWRRHVNYYADDRPPLRWKVYNWARQLSAVCGLIRDTANRCRVSVLPPANAPPPLVDRPVYSAAELLSCRIEFERRLEAIALYGERIAAHTVLIIPPGNDAGFDPSLSFLAAETPYSEREQFARDFLAATELEKTNEAKAVNAYQALLDRQPGFAEAHYRMGVLLGRGGSWDEAYRHFVAARDHDGFPIRCLTSFQQVYRDVAARRKCILVDGQAVFHAVGRHGLLDDYMFQDGMHPSLRGYITLAQHVLDELYAKRAFGWPAERPSRKITLVECAAHFGFKARDWMTLCERGAMFYYGTMSMRFDRTYRLAKFKAFEAAAGRIGAGDPPEAVGLPNIGINTAP
jgi:lysophospholipase L1-like esterase